MSELLNNMLCSLKFVLTVATERTKYSAILRYSSNGLVENENGEDSIIDHLKSQSTCCFEKHTKPFCSCNILPLHVKC